jgi:hypothetical protein
MGKKGRRMGIKELEALAERKGFYLTELNEDDKANVIKTWDDAEDVLRARYLLEDIEDEKAEIAYFKTEQGLRTFLGRFPDKG